MDRLKKLEFKKYMNIYTVICLCALCAGVNIFFLAMKNGGFLIVADDFNAQQIPFTVALHKQIVEYGIDSWMWNLDLGTSTIHGMGFYELGSPFFWITMLTPANRFPYIVPFVYVLKYIVAGITSYLYISQYMKEKKWAITGALTYAFSGFQSINLEFYHFHDIVALFPLLLLGLDLLIGNDKRGKILFPIAVFINCICNYYFFIIEIVFMVGYYVCKYGKEGFRVRNILKPVTWGGMGVGLAAVFFIPNVLYILDSPRSDLKIYLGNIVWSPQDFLLMIKGLLFPAEAQNNLSAIEKMNWNSISLFIPLFGLLLSIRYLKIEGNSWLSRLMKILFVCSLSPIGCSIFLMFREWNFRWYFTLALMLSLSTSIVLDREGLTNIRRVSVGYGAVVILLAAMIYLLPWSSESPEACVYNAGKFISVAFITVAGIVLTFALSYMKKNRMPIIVALSIFCMISTGFTLFDYYSTGDQTYVENYMNKFNIASKLTSPNEQYRFVASDNLITLTGGANGTSSFSSTVEPSIIKFDSLFGYSANNTRMAKDSIPGLAELLAGKYYLSRGSSDSIGEYASGNMTLYLHEQNACPIGFGVNNYILESEFKKLALEDRAKILFSAAIVEDIGGFEHENFNSVDSINADCSGQISELANRAESNAVSSFVRTKDGFSCLVDYACQTLVYFTVPYESGWSALIDGKDKEIINSGGMMLLDVPPGKHDIAFYYRTPGYSIGKIISITSFALFIVHCCVVINKDRKQLWGMHAMASLANGMSNNGRRMGK